jgi:hypothetical protein
VLGDRFTLFLLWHSYVNETFVGLYFGYFADINTSSGLRAHRETNGMLDPLLLPEWPDRRPTMSLSCEMLRVMARYAQVNLNMVQIVFDKSPFVWLYC